MRENKQLSKQLFVEKKPLRGGEIELNPLALGCWSFGGAHWGTQEDLDSFAVMEYAINNDITHFDTAQDYGRGRSEKVVGKFLKQMKCREDVFIATKTSALDKPMAQAVELSLDNLQTDYIDLFYIHWPRKGMHIANIIEELEIEKNKGRIKAIGVSNFDVGLLKEAMKAGAIDANQFCYNLIWRWSEQELIPFCMEHDISVVTYSSIAQGILTGKFPKNPTFPKGDDRPRTTFFKPEVWSGIFEGIEKMKDIAEENNRPLVHYAIRWVLAQTGINSVLVGARNLKQVKQNVEAIEGKISSEVLEEFSRLSNQIIKYIPDTENIFQYYPYK